MFPDLYGHRRCTDLCSAVSSNIPALFFTLFRNRGSSETVVPFRRCRSETVVYMIHRGSTLHSLRYFAPAVRFYLWGSIRLSTAPGIWRAAQAFILSELAEEPWHSGPAPFLILTRNRCLPETVGSLCRCCLGTVVDLTSNGIAMQPPLQPTRSGCSLILSLLHGGVASGT